MLRSVDVPQANILARVVSHVRDAHATSASERRDRDFEYYSRAAQILGWLDDDRRPTASGIALLEKSDRLPRMRIAFAASAVGRAWLEWSEVESVRELDRATAEAFLKEASELAESTATRRAATLRQWLDALQASSASLPDALSLPITEADLPTRMRNWCKRNGVSSLRALVTRDPVEMLSERNLGRGSVRDTDARVQDLTGISWAAWHNRLANVDGQDSQEREDHTRFASWNLSVPTHALDVELSILVDLPTRIRSYADSEGLKTLADLLNTPMPSLASAPNIGRRSIDVARIVISEYVEKVERSNSLTPEAWEPQPAEFASLRDYLVHVLSDEPFQDRMIVTQRAGLQGPVATLQEVGSFLGVTRERIRQLEKRVVDRLVSRGIGALLEKHYRAEHQEELFGVVVDQADYWLDEDGGRDVFSFAAAKLFPTSAQLLDVGEALWLTPSKSKAKHTIQALAAIVKNASYPVAALALREELARSVSDELRELERELIAHAMEPVEVRDGKAMGHTRTNAAAALIWLRQQPRPVPVESLRERGLFHFEGTEVRYFDRGLVGLEAHFPDIDKWQARLVPVCVARMRSEPGRQWSCVELFDEVTEAADLPSGFNAHWLAILARRDERITYLGRLRVALPDSDASGERIHIADLLHRLLLDAGAPILKRDLIGLAAKTVPNNLGLESAAITPPIVSFADGRAGLIERDVPGGMDAMQSAAESLVDFLEGRGRGFPLVHAVARVAALSEAHAKWDAGFTLSVARLDPRLRVTNSEIIALAAWEDAGVPSAREILLRHLEEGEGKANVSALLDEIEETLGRRLNNNGVAALASNLGLSKRGDAIVAREDEVSSSEAPLASSPSTPALPLLLEKIPNAARPLFSELLSADAISGQSLRGEVATHSANFLEARKTNEFLDLDELRSLQQDCERLISEMEATTAENRRIAQAAVRYFAIEHDGDTDFTIGGLDDDQEVMNAVFAWLGLNRT